MIAATPHRSQRPKEAHAQGWLVSVLLHGAVAFTAILLMKQVTFMPKDEAFKWNVAIVSPVQSAQSTASPQNEDQAATVPPTTSAPSPPEQQTPPPQTLSSPQPSAQQTPPPISERAATPEIPEPPAATPTQPAPPSLSTTAHTTPSAEPIAQETMAPMAAEPSSLVKPVGVSTAASAESDSMAPPSDQAPAQMAAMSQAPSNPASKRDYSWLSEAILRRLEELKRYPASARLDEAKGKVVVQIVIHDDGNLSAVEVFQSSGYPTLDKAAIETMRQAAPFHLPHPLGQPSKTIRVPISYRLDR